MSQPILQTIDGLNIYYSENHAAAWIIVNNQIQRFYFSHDTLRCWIVSVEYLQFEMFENIAPRLIKKIFALFGEHSYIENGNLKTLILTIKDKPIIGNNSESCR